MNNSTDKELREELIEMVAKEFRDAHDYPSLKAKIWPDDFAKKITLIADDYTEALIKERVREARIGGAREKILSQLKDKPFFDQQLFFGGLAYSLFMAETNATSVDFKLENFSHKKETKGDLVITAQLKKGKDE